MYILLNKQELEKYWWEYMLDALVGSKSRYDIIGKPLEKPSWFRYPRGCLLFVYKNILQIAKQLIFRDFILRDNLITLKNNRLKSLVI